jgi:hypothetical protein
MNQAQDLEYRSAGRLNPKNADHGLFDAKSGACYS